ncbi:MAG TPA: hypothetical protein PLW65_25520, partial [Pseudomonadota bacterium]|nr:hypothetical protein [Pseudomonadota bacterium]
MTQLSELPAAEDPSGRVPRRTTPLLRRYVELCARHPGRLLLFFLLLGVLAIYPIAGLELHTDLAELLPDEHPAVQ